MTVAGADDWVTTVSDEGTGFTATIEAHIGDSPVLRLDVDNASDGLANAVLELNVPAGVDVETEESGSAIAVAQLSRKTWLMTVASDPDNSEIDMLNITISPKDSLAPGFYTITGQLLQISY